MTISTMLLHWSVLSNNMADKSDKIFSYILLVLYGLLTPHTFSESTELWHYINLSIIIIIIITKTWSC